MGTVDQITRIRELIVAELDLCDSNSTPYVCSNTSEADSKAQVVEAVLQTVLARKMEIGQAILEYEREFNPNMLD